MNAKIQKINYFGFLENNKIIDLLKKMHIFSYPSIWLKRVVLLQLNQWLLAVKS